MKKLSGSSVRSCGDGLLLGGIQQILKTATQLMESIAELIMSSFGGRPRNGPISAFSSDMGITVGVGAVTELLPISEGAAQLRVLSEKMVVKNTSLLTLVARSAAST
jgi:hypothetical protein